MATVLTKRYSNAKVRLDAQSVKQVMQKHNEYQNTIRYFLCGEEIRCFNA